MCASACICAMCVSGYNIYNVIWCQRSYASTHRTNRCAKFKVSHAEKKSRYENDFRPALQWNGKEEKAVGGKRMKKKWLEKLEFMKLSAMTQGGILKRRIF